MGCTESKAGGAPSTQHPPRRVKETQRVVHEPAAGDYTPRKAGCDKPALPEVLSLPSDDSVVEAASLDLEKLVGSKASLEAVYPAGRQQYLQCITPALQPGATAQDLAIYHSSALEEPAFNSHLKTISNAAAATLLAEHGLHLKGLLRKKYAVTPGVESDSLTQRITDAQKAWAAKRATAIVTSHFEALGKRRQEEVQKKVLQGDSPLQTDRSALMTSRKQAVQKRVRLPSVQGQEYVIKKNVLYLIVAKKAAASPAVEGQESAAHEVYAFNASTDQQITLRVKFDTAAGACRGKEVTVDAEGYFVLVVMPCETMMVVRGAFPAGLASLDAIPTYSTVSNAEALRVRHDLSKTVISDDMMTLSSTLPSVTFEAPMTDAPGTESAQAVARHCVVEKIPFVDPFFPPLLSSLYSEEGNTSGCLTVPWARPRSFLSAMPTVIPAEASPLDIEAGALGDGWLVSAFAILAENPKLLTNIFTNNGSRHAEERQYGVHRLCLCVSGVWRERVVDDYLPCAGKVPLYARNRIPSELWVSLLEKAYAKAHGSYKAIVRGDAFDALSDITGFPVLKLNQEGELTPDMWEELRGLQRDHQGLLFLGTETLTDNDASHNKEVTQRLAGMDLNPGFSYAVLRMEEVQLAEGRQARLMQIRSPWSVGADAGRWCSSSPLWHQHPKAAEQCRVSPRDAELGLRWVDFDETVASRGCFSSCALLHTPSADNVRYTGRLLRDSGIMDFVVKVEVEREITLVLSLHQDAGRQHWSREPSLAAIRSVIMKEKPDGHMEVVSFSHPVADEEGEVDGVFSPCANVSAMPVTLPAGVYYMIGEAANSIESVEANKTKELVLSAHISPRGSGTVLTTMGTTDAMATSLQLVDFYGFLAGRDPSPVPPQQVQLQTDTLVPAPTVVTLN
eukprot:TRINITY_DN28487_c1_g2_i1.p1 TRINITY_DN28487_c1_g2~~TRINITY_DN28487_c1_g2_i1.p1  ORF type:complete len:915 (+),score=361.79 TRINITY_DN28487_c1_g2_i1:33-2747(+)